MGNRRATPTADEGVNARQRRRVLRDPTPGGAERRGVGARRLLQFRRRPAWRPHHAPRSAPGLFAQVRTPIFTAMGVTELGLTVVVPDAVSVVGFVALVVALQLQVRIVEEPYRRRVHAMAYARYEATTGFLAGARQVSRRLARGRRRAGRCAVGA